MIGRAEVWIFPFLVLLGVSAYATYEAAQANPARCFTTVRNIEGRSEWGMGRTINWQK